MAIFSQGLRGLAGGAQTRAKEHEKEMILLLLDIRWSLRLCRMIRLVAKGASTPGQGQRHMRSDGYETTALGLGRTGTL